MSRVCENSSPMSESILFVIELAIPIHFAPHSIFIRSSVALMFCRLQYVYQSTCITGAQLMCTVLARTLHSKPSLLLLAEPTNHLDLRARL